MASMDLYEILGVTNADEDQQIKEKYQKLLLVSHPDKGGDRETFENIKLAFDVLSNPSKRRQYDKHGLEGLKMTSADMLHSAFTGESFSRNDDEAAQSVTRRLEHLESKNAELEKKVMLYQREGHVMSHEAGFEAWLRNAGTTQTQTVTTETLFSTNAFTSKAVPIKVDPAPAVMLTGSGFSIDELPSASSLSAGQVLVQWLCAPITMADVTSFRAPREAGFNVLPAHAGLEGVGYVEQVGEGCSIKPNSLVIPLGAGCGTFRTSAIVHESALIALPKTDVAEEQLACMMSLVCAYQLLQTVETLKPGDTIVQGDPCSTVGQAVIQLARLLNITTINLLADSADYEQQAESLKQLGADYVLRSSAKAAGEINACGTSQPRLGLVVSDAPAAMAIAEVMRPGCTMCCYGDAQGNLAGLQLPMKSLLEGLKISGFNFMPWAKKHRNEVIEIVDIMLQLLSDQKVSLVTEAWGAFPDSFEAAAREAQTSDGHLAQKLLKFATLDEAQDRRAASTAQQGKYDEIAQWLAEVSLDQYANVFTTKGYDDLETIKSMGLTEEDLDFLEVKPPLHRRKLLSHSKSA